MDEHLAAVAKAIDYIEDNLGLATDLASVAAEVGYSKFHLHRIFEKTVGLTVHDYARHRAMTESAKLLAFSGRPVSEIALIAGYDSQQAFSAAFKSLYKQTPAAFGDSGRFYPLLLRYRVERVSPKELLQGAGIRSISAADVPLWMDFLSLVVDGFPELDTAKHRKALERYIAEGGAYVLASDDTFLGCMLMDRGEGSIDFLAVHPQVRAFGALETLLNFALDTLSGEVSTTTYREGDSADTGHRKALLKLGFAERELLTEFGYPTQRMVKRKDSRND